MTYCASEIIDLAKKLSQTQNSKAFDFQLLVHLLNNVYSGIYKELSTSQAFVKEVEINSKKEKLPEDCFQVISVSKNGFIINNSSNSYHIPGTYTIENGYIDFGVSGNYKVKYTTMPETLTANNTIEYLRLTSDNSFIPYIEFDPIENEHCVIYFDGTDYYSYNIEQKSKEKLPVAPTTPIRKFNQTTISHTTTDGIITSILIDNEEKIEYFEKEDLDLVFIQNDNEHIVAVYEDKNHNKYIYIYDTFLNNYEFNPFISKGKYFNMIGFDIFTDDSDGGIILLSDTQGNLAISSYTPDTILEFPENTFFDVLIDRLAIQFSGLNGVENRAIETKLTNDEISFYATINRTNQGIRIRNDMRGKYGI